MDIAGALIEGVFHQPVDDTDNMLIFGIDFTGFSEFDELFEILKIARHFGRGLVAGALHCPADAVKLDLVIFQFPRICQYRGDRTLDDPVQLIHPFEIVGIGQRDHDFAVGNLDRQDAESRRVGVGDYGGAGSNIHFKGIEVISAYTGLLGQPVGQHVERQHLLRLLVVSPLPVGNDFQRMQGFSVLGGNQRGHHAGLFLLDDILGYQGFEYPFQGTGGFDHDLVLVLG